MHATRSRVLLPPSAQGDECDSFTFQTVGCGAVELVAQSMKLPLVRAALNGGCVLSSCEYEATEGDEVEDLMRRIQLAEIPRRRGAVAWGCVVGLPAAACGKRVPQIEADQPCPAVEGTVAAAGRPHARRRHRCCACESEPV